MHTAYEEWRVLRAQVTCVEKGLLSPVRGKSGGEGRKEREKKKRGAGTGRLLTIIIIETSDPTRHAPPRPVFRVFRAPTGLGDTHTLFRFPVRGMPIPVPQHWYRKLVSDTRNIWPLKEEESIDLSLLEDLLEERCSVDRFWISLNTKKRQFL